VLRNPLFLVSIAVSVLNLAAALEAAVDQLETAVSARERDNVRLVRLEAAANDAIAALDSLLE
jgi:hypothetical protein